MFLPVFTDFVNPSSDGYAIPMVWNPFKRTPHDTIPDAEPESVSSEGGEDTLPTLPPPPEKRTEQQRDVVEAREVPGFEGLEVAYTLQKKVSSMGKNVRNDDAALADPETGLLGVFDGLGGVPNSHLASAMAVRELPQIYALTVRQQALVDDEEVMKRLATKIRLRTDENIAQIPLENDALITKEEAESTALIAKIAQDPSLARKTLALCDSLEIANENIAALEVQTTACVSFVHHAEDGKRYFVAANIGDSAALFIHPDRRIEQVTHEDSYQNELMRKGELSRELLLQMKREPHKQFAYPTTNEKGERIYGALSYFDIMPALTRRLGGGDVLPSISVTELPPHVQVILCTDGVTDKFETKPTSNTTPENVLETSFDAMALANVFLLEETLPESINALRTDAAERMSYKTEDDIAIVALKAKEEPTA